jgi:cytochrome c oxidase subunit 2
MQPIMTEKLAPKAGETPAEFGERVFAEMECWNCHSTDGSPLTGPSLKGIFQQSRRLADGSTVTADHAYIRESVRRPNDKVVEGFAPLMPSYEGRLTEEQELGLSEFIKSLK